MTKKLEEIKEMLKNATPGPWQVDPGNNVVTVNPPPGKPYRMQIVEGELSNQGGLDAELIAHAPEYLAYCVERIEKLEAMIITYEMFVHEVVASGLPGKRISELLELVRAERGKILKAESEALKEEE